MGEGSMRTNVSELRMRVRVDFCYAQHICKKNAVIQKPAASELYMLRNSVTKIVTTILYSLMFTVYYTRLTL